MNAPHCPRCGVCHLFGCCGRCRPHQCRPHMNHTKGGSVLKGGFRECTEWLRIIGGECFSSAFPTHNTRTITVFAKNVGENPVTLSLQNSPNGLDYVEDPQKLELEAGKTGYLVPYIFSKYTRAVARSDQAGVVCIWAQMQDHCYFQHLSGNT